MPHVQNGTANPPFVCEDVARCEFCLAPSAIGCVHHLMSADELAAVRRDHERRAPGRPRLRCQCHPDCTRAY